MVWFIPSPARCLLNQADGASWQVERRRAEERVNGPPTRAARAQVVPSPAKGSAGLFLECTPILCR